MKIFSASQIKAWDAYTIQHEPIASIDLMERAAQECVLWLGSHLPKDKQVYIFCGPGNNGGDGLSIARLLREKGVTIHVYIAETGTARSTDCAANLQELTAMGEPVAFVQNIHDLPAITKDAIIIDALYGYGLNRPLSGLPESIVNHINASGATVVVIDMPSGLYADKSSVGNTIVKATYTLSFQIMKLAFLLPENAAYTGEVEILDIGLHAQYYKDTAAQFAIISHEYIHALHQPRKRFSHKGTYGNAALIAGSYGMMGAAVLGATACMRSGAGKLTCYIPGCGYNIVQTAIPEAMCVTDDNQTHHTQLQVKTKYDAYAIGPGMGMFEETAAVMEELFDEKPERLIIDADGLNVLSAHPSLLSTIPRNTILTPHPKEFEKLFGSTTNQFERLELALTKAKALQVYILIKGNFSFIATPSGKGYFNPTGNPGMATAGSGDVLTGLLLGLYAQYEQTEMVVLMGVYLHGLAGDVAAKEKTEEAMIAGDIIDYLPQAYMAIKKAVYFT